MKLHFTSVFQQPDLTNVNLPWPQRKFQGYYKIARHYKWALNQIFYKFNYTSVIIVEGKCDNTIRSCFVVFLKKIRLVFCHSNVHYNIIIRDCRYSISIYFFQLQGLNRTSLLLFKKIFSYVFYNNLVENMLKYSSIYFLS